jgi:PAS domain S-box-containing protein
MASRATLSRWAAGLLVAATIIALSAAGLFLADDATVGRARLGPYYPALLVLAALVALALGTVIALQVWRLMRAVRARQPGARLNARLLWLLLAIGVLPALIVFVFALNFLFGTVDSRFAAPVASALDDALEVGRLYLEERRADAEDATANLARRLSRLPPADWQAELDRAIDEMAALQLGVLAADGSLRASASADPDWLRPETPAEQLRLRLGTDGHFAVVESRDDDLVLRALARIDVGALLALGDVVQAVFPVPPRYAPLARRIDRAVADYRQLDFLRGALKLSMAIILGLVLMLVLLAALLLALRGSRRLVTPVAHLAEATAAIGRGEYQALPSPTRDDELGDLVLAFNSMSDELGRARANILGQQALLEAQRAYLDAVLARISSAVIGVDGQGHVRLLNAAAEQLLGVSAERVIGSDPAALASTHPALAPFVQRIGERRNDMGDWHEEVRLEAATPARTLLLRGRALAEADGRWGQLVVFDDASALGRSQRDQLPPATIRLGQGTTTQQQRARRLAHEIKNPLTPIQLAAERLRRRYLGRLPPDDAEVLERATGTIVSQVESLKSLVNAFSDYARPQPPRRVHIGLNALVGDVLALYGQDARLRIEQALAPGEITVQADPDRLRQVLHNLIKNAVEAMAESPAPLLSVTTALVEHDDRQQALIEVRDHGPGLPDDFDVTTLEPYRSSKPRGSGLGLVIVQRIVSEHGGRLEAVNAAEGGARMRLWLPV